MPRRVEFLSTDPGQTHRNNRPQRSDAPQVGREAAVQRSGGPGAAMGGPGWEPPGALRAEGVRQADLPAARNPQATHGPQAPPAALRRTASGARSGSAAQRWPLAAMGGPGWEPP